MAQLELAKDVTVNRQIRNAQNILVDKHVAREHWCGVSRSVAVTDCISAPRGCCQCKLRDCTGSQK